MSAALPVHLFHVNQPEINFIYQGSGLQGVAAALAVQVAFRDLAQVLND
jgi:hypothetical protein